MADAPPPVRTALPRAELLVDREVTDEAAHALSAHFSDAGYAVTTRRVLEDRGLEELTWIVLAALPLQAFLSGLGNEAVTDAYRGLKALVTRIRPGASADADAGSGAVPSARDGVGVGVGTDAGEAVPLVLQDPGTRLRIVLEADLPEEAYAQLTRLDLTAFRIGPLHYDRALGRWRSPLDEAAGPGRG
ncbi:hypothetical protein OIE63_29225 [Streptomyces sp. NBC_01795]|uniref:hypothetical protein n=1 Tax=unclassified Streptomyces TaxID=2593676 RepID=UPI002DDAAFCD|nr:MULTISPECIES: hypothetical protein [unclassified Streptomyces]WSA95181.1 hypothetical protein OIE63_29225 [Streptomyces sp. NBC_01795]WSB79600.1 hypothetical protein OHB04_30335 [Streptomyces sp. NBC_01775]